VFCEPEGEGEVGGQTHLNNQWSHVLGVFAGGAFHLPSLVGEHGATLAARRHRVWGTQLAWSRCNHGRCPWEPGMAWKCEMRSSYTRQHHVHKEACNTRSNVFSGWIGPRGHACNDDVVMQQFGVRYNQHYWGGYGSGWPCDDPYLNQYTPACFW
jgi:hypothetical protein